MTTSETASEPFQRARRPEQIFLELTAREWAPWAGALHDGLDGAAPGSAGLVAHVVARSFALLAGSVWQIANPAPAPAELFASDPALALARVDLAPRLRRTAEVLLAGLIPSRPCREPRPGPEET